MLSKNSIVNVKALENRSNLCYEVDILLKLLPFFDVPLQEKADPQSKKLRMLLGISKPDADMI